MYTKMSPDLILEGVIVSLQNDVMPYLNSEKAAVTVVMMQAMLQSLRQTIPVYLQTLAHEHNDMLAAISDAGRIVGETPGPAADRLRARVTECASREQFGQLPSTEAVMTAHYESTLAMEELVRSLDELIDAGHENAERALQRIREHLGPRIANDFFTMSVGEGMAGRG